MCDIIRIPRRNNVSIHYNGGIRVKWTRVLICLTWYENGKHVEIKRVNNKSPTWPSPRMSFTHLKQIKYSPFDHIQWCFRVDESI